MVTASIRAEDVTVPRIVGWLLVLGAILFWAGAVTPPYRQWMGVSTEEYLTIVGAHRRNWYVMHALFGAGAAVTVAALAGLAGVLRASGDRIWSGIGLTLFSVATVLWLMQAGFRVAVAPWAASELARGGQVPPVYPALHQWTSVLFAAFMIMGYLALAAYGAALLGTPILSRWAGWVALVFGLVAVPGFATVVFRPPLMLFVVPFVLGIAALRAGPSATAAVQVALGQGR
jgi:hypothetical protein